MRVYTKKDFMRTILFLTHHLYEDLELWYPKIRLQEAGFKTQVASLERGVTYNGKYGYPCKSDLSFEDVHSTSFAGLVIPGGYAPDHLRRYPQALKIVRDMDGEKKPIAFICHAGWVLISAHILKDRHVTGFSAIQDDLKNAGARYSDQPVVVDGNLISSRSPEDLPQFCKALLDILG
jgi:protease I